jgi:hypothetical protein
MTRSAKIAVSAACLALTAAILGAVTPAHSNSGRATTTIRYAVKFSPQKIVDVAPKGFSRGDGILSWDVLYKGGKKAGHDTQSCVLTNLQPLEADCTLTFVFPDGTITAQYMGTPPAHKIAAVTGGTGRYIGASGEVDVFESGHDATGNTATFKLLQ